MIGKEVRSQITEKTGKLPDVMIACVGGGSNSIGFFNDFLDEKDVRMIGAEAGGRGTKDGEHASRITGKSGKLGIVQGYKSLFLQDDEGQLLPTHSISAGLDYAGIGPQLAYLAETGRIEFTRELDDEVIAAYKFFAREEGVIAALESSHALSACYKLAPKLEKTKNIVVNISGRGDKDIFITAAALKDPKWFEFLKDEVARYENQR